MFSSFAGTFLLLAVAFAIANLVLIPTKRLRSFPIHSDDFRNLATTFATVDALPARPVSTYGLALFATAGDATYYGVLAFLTLLYPALVLWFVVRLFGRKVSPSTTLLSGLLLFAFPRSVEYPMYTGLITNLLSGTLGIAGMLLLARAAQAKSSGFSAAVAGLLCAASAFAKEDYVLVCLFFATWLFWSNRRNPRPRRPVLIGLAMIITADITLEVYNRFIGGRAFTNLTATGPYTVDLSARSISSLFLGYLKLSPYVLWGTFFFSAAVVSGFLLLPDWRDRIGVVVGCVALLIAPYTVLPNHVYEYYVWGWLAWEAAFAALVLAELASRHARFRRAFLAGGAAVALAALLLACPTRRATVLFYRINQDRNERIVATLLRNRDEINRHAEVAVVGVEGLSPWSHCHAEYLRRRLGLNNRWVVYVPKETMFYPLNETGWIAVRRLSQLPRDQAIPVLAFAPNGDGVLRQGPPPPGFTWRPAGSPEAAIEAVYPRMAEAGSSFQVQPGGSSAIAVKGRGFGVYDRIRWNDVELETAYGGPTLLTAIVPAELLERPGTAVISVAGARATFLVLPRPAARTPVH